MGDSENVAKALMKGKPKESHVKIGLVDNTSGKHFMCGTCEYFKEGVCHHENPKLHGRKVHPAWCCNLYSHEGMKTIVE